VSEHPLLNGRHNIVVMSDEAHRSQYGLKAKLGNDGTYKFGYAKHMRDALKNAAFIGFTGTRFRVRIKTPELSLVTMFPSMTFRMPSMMVQPSQSTTNHAWQSWTSIRLKLKNYLIKSMRL
jgi:hypothetical protein